MSNRWLVSVEKVRRYAQESPEFLTAVHCAVYDQDGNETIIKGYRLDQMLEQGFLEQPPTKAQMVTQPTGDAEPVLRAGVRSRRAQPRMAK